jgi:GNAT superfamily N-acetyltransferase
MVSREYRVRRADIDDLGILAGLFDRYRVFYEQDSDPSAAETFLRTRLEAGESVIIMAEDADGRGLGFTQLYPMFSSVRMRPIWILNDLFVEKAARRAGVGRALLEAAAGFARESGAAGLELATARDNEPAKSVYERMGWKLDEAFDHYSLDV